ncbi:DNA helicase RecQ [Clostridium magnum]|uniref:DNA helicase RecQ n=1 Tax=Clostridium magnum DSM 2767 TaxID=1121326 RepID=A0A161WHL8_9CLOT|nr:DNA helicase RecQ [Clostridium magnum]KZL91185.1 ATP-dependent DNA helicase RecQ [Clostridium magnum DSM 2767]SHI17512.1 ATP-dependent DNA helicase, RecQ-like [Clostridium magnum DSM 2767]
MIEEAKKLLKRYYGYDTFREGQEKVINSILTSKDTFGIMPTGAGKSICYQIPALMLSGITIVVSPLISLMKDQVDSLNNIGIKASFINSTLDQHEVQERILMAVSGYTKLLYVAPERLESESFCQLLKTMPVSMVAIDESHCVSQWGHDFRPSYRSIAPLIRNISPRPIISAFTATATEDVKNDVVRLLGLKDPDIYTTGFDRENLFFSVIRGENKKDYILKYVEDNRESVGVIYAATRKEVDSIYELLKIKGYSVGKYHAGLNDSERTKAQEDFLYDNINIIVATNAFGMGIDKSNVRYVIHYNIPRNMEAYYQEAGRAGRDGEPSECILLFAAQDIVLQKFLIEQSIFSEERRVNEYRRLQDMVDYCHTTKCLRKYILEYFGDESGKEKCDNCSNCKDETELTDITIEAQKIFSCIARVKQRFGTVLVAQVLKGSKDKKVIELQFDKLSTYGIMKGYTIKEVKDLINILIADNYLALSEGQFPVVRLKERAVEVLKGEQKVFQKIQKRKVKAAEDNSLFAILKALRKSISEREMVPPYIIFADSTLREMSEKYPIDEEAILSIKGVGESKLKKYGEEFLKVIVNYVKDNNLQGMSGTLNYNEHNENHKEVAIEKEEIPSHVITLNMFNEGKSLKEITELRNLKFTTIEDHIMRCVLEGMDVDLDSIIPKQYEEAIIEAIKKAGAEKLKPIKEILPEEVSYTAIKAVLCKIKIKI